MNSLDLTVLDLAVPAISQGLRPTSTDLLWITDIYGFMVAGFLITIPRCLARSGISAGEGATGEPPSTSGRRHSKRRIRPQTAFPGCGAHGGMSWAEIGPWLDRPSIATESA
jgi:hypothetical protein